MDCESQREQRHVSDHGDKIMMTMLSQWEPI